MATTGAVGRSMVGKLCGPKVIGSRKSTDQVATCDRMVYSRLSFNAIVLKFSGVLPIGGFGDRQC